LSLQRAESLAFAGRLAAAEAALRRSTPRSDRDRAVRAWTGAYLAAARGRFSAAERATRALITDGRLDPELHARVAATLGSVLRQTGRHAEARVVESTALARRPGGPARAHLLIGLVADAVGIGDLAGVDRGLRRIGPRPPGGWRVRVRLRWVRCERELLAGRPATAATHARRAHAIADAAGARRHVAKSLLFQGAALREAGETTEARRALRRAHSIAARIGAEPIERVAADLLRRTPGRTRGRR